MVSSISLVALLSVFATPAAAPSTQPSDRTPAIPVLERLVGEWNVLGRTRSTPDAAWSEFRTAAVVEPLFEGTVVRERAPGAGEGKPWRELAYISAEADGQRVRLVHVFAGSLNVLRMEGPVETEAGETTVPFRGAWERRKGELTKREPASGRLDFSGDGYAWRLDARAPDGTTFVDLELIYTRR